MTQLVWNGLFVGSFYALVALGYSMVYGIIKLLNFAHGDVYMLGAFVGFAVLGAVGGVSPSMALPVLLAVLLATMLVTGLQQTPTSNLGTNREGTTGSAGAVRRRRMLVHMSIPHRTRVGQGRRGQRPGPVVE